MPYIKQEDRKELLDAAKVVAEHLSNSSAKAGELNYFVSIIANELLKEPSYSKINELIGALECIKLELYRRMASPYEDIKMHQNGDVYNSPKP